MRGMETKGRRWLRIGEQRTMDMTEGDIFLLLARFALPLLLGNVFQQLYNTVDTWVVGNFVSNEAFSAVGSVTPAINTLISGMTGLSNGATVVISQFYGAKRLDAVRRTVSTALTVTFLLAIVLSAAGILLIPFIMSWMRIPAEVQPAAVAYLTIYFGGLIGMLLYNIGAGILRAVGDSTRPFLFLLVTTVLNILLDLLLVLRFEMGVSGVAWATVISQGVAAVLVLTLLARTNTCVRWDIRENRVDGAIFRKIVRIGMPSAVQLMTMSFSNMFAYSYINAFGADCMSGWTAYGKLDQILALPIQSLSLASSTFTAQNVGKGDVRRAKQGVHTAYIMALAVAALAAVPVVIFAPQLVRFFNSKPEVVGYGARITRVLIPIYVLNCATLIYSGVLRGAGKTWGPTIIMFCTLVVLRQAYLFVVANYVSNTIIPIVMSFPVGWLSCGLGSYLYYKHTSLDGGVVDR